MGFGLEVEMIREAHDLGLLTAPVRLRRDEAEAMAEAGADVLVPHMGLTTKGTIGAQTAMTLDECVERDPGDARRGDGGEPGRARAVPRRPDRRARGRRATFSSAREGVVGFFGARASSGCRPRSR